ncbi:acyl-CoA desaturase, partial [Cellulosimicrobium cellulans]|nr:acyl-CoA desaturase [Cellulosimicrobium composti]
MSASSEAQQPLALTGRVRSAARSTARDYSVLAKIVRESGLLRRRYGYYWTRLVLTVAAFGAVWAG